MGGVGSGRKSPKFEAGKCLLSNQMDLWELINMFDDNRITREELKQFTQDIFKKTKVTQEEIERL